MTMTPGSPRTRIGQDGQGPGGAGRVGHAHPLVAMADTLPLAPNSRSGGLSLATAWRSS